MFALNNKVIIVSGGTGILGGAFIKAIASQGSGIVYWCSNRNRNERKER